MSDGRSATRFRVRLADHGPAGYVVSAASPQAAAAVVLRAHRIAHLVDVHLAGLQDGQTRCVDPAEVPDPQVSCMLLDDAGVEHLVPPASGAAINGGVA